ncbi:MAG: hypothetical protein QM758_14930 [Armatimonas sp.]
MRHPVERLFRPVIGQQISSMYRYLGSQRFDIGTQQYVKNQRGKKVWKSDAALVVSCFWEIAGLDGPIVGSDDFGPGRERRDGDEAQAFYKLLPLDRIWIHGVESKNNNGFQLRLSHGFTLTVLPIPPVYDLVVGAEEVELRASVFYEDEFWHFMPNILTRPRRRTYLCTRRGIERAS